MRHTTRAAGVLLVFLLMLGGLSVAAQDRPRGTVPEDSQSGVRARIQENLITLKLLRMTQALNLTSEQTAAIYPVMTRLEKDKYDSARKLDRATRELRLLVSRDKPDEARVVSLMSEINVLREDIRARDQEMADFMKGKLSVVQNAKYLLFSADFYQGLGERLLQLRQLRNRNRFTR